MHDRRHSVLDVAAARARVREHVPAYMRDSAAESRTCVRVHARCVQSARRPRVRGCVATVRASERAPDHGTRRRERNREIIQKPNRRRGRPWKCKMGTVWSIVCAMNLGLFPESSLKDITFVNFFHHIFMKKLCSAEGITGADLEDDSDHEEPKPVNNNNNTNTSAATLWPFMHAVRSAPALNNSVRKRGKRRRGRWTQKRQKKPRDVPTVLMVKRPRIDDAANAKSAMMKQRRAKAAAVSSSASSLKSGPVAGSPGYNYSFMALHSRLPGGSKVDETRDYLTTTSSAYRAAPEDGVREPPTTRETDTASEPPAATDRSASRRSGTGATTLSSDMQEPKRARRSAANLPTGHTDYYKNVARVNDDMGDIWEDTTSNSDENDEGDDRNNDDDDDDDDDITSTSTGRRAVTRGKKKADLANGDSSDHESTSSRDTTGRRLPSRRRRNRLLENRKERDGSSSVLLRNGKIRKRRQRRRRSVAIDVRGSRLVLAARRNSSRQQSLRRRVVAAAPAPTKDAELAEKTWKRCDYCTNRPRRRSNAGGASCTCKENLKNTATAILRDIRAHIHNADANQRSAEDVETTEDPDEGRDCEGESDRNVSMKYEWEDDWEDEDGGGSNATTADNEETTSPPKVKAPARTYPGRKPRKKRRWHKAPIDCEFVDRTETTYQSVLPERVDDSTTPSTPSLKIHVDEVNWVSEESDVGGSMLHLSLEPRSSLSERRDPETAPAADEFFVAADDGHQDGAARQERNALMASACYVYPETTTPSNNNAVAGADVAKAPADARPARSNAKTDTHRENPTKDVITYGKRSVGKTASLTDRGSGDRKSQDSAKVQAKSAADSNKDNDSDNENEKKYGLRRRSTRSSINSTKESNVGKLIWGNCSGWWPALIVEADQVGMAPESGKMWVYWIGESQISLLNEKTQIEPFSRKLEERLTQKFRKNNTRSQAIDETIKMLRQRYECTLTKPYYYWIRRNIKAEELDNLCFYPYPTKIQERLDALKQQNAKATEQYILKQKSGSPEPTKKQMVEKAKDTKALKQMEDERLPLREQIPGVITWAKITGHNWWPAMVIDYRDCCLKEPGFGCQWIMWYGDYTVSQVHHLAFLKFHKGIEKLRDYIENTKKHVYLMGVLQASKDYCSRLGCNTDNWSLDNVFKYFSDMTNIHVPYNHLQVSESNKVYDKYSNEIIKKINELKSNPNVDSKRKDDIKESDALRRVMLEQSKLNKLCLKCLTFPKDVLEAHPFFEGSLCRECSNDFKPCMFVFGNDDKCFYCTVCAATGTVVICDREDCPRVYCTACLKYLLCPEVYEEMLLEDPWECFLCRDKSTLPKGLLRPRDDWKDRFAGMFRTGTNPVSNMNIVNSNGEKRGVRVLSLFDGLSTGLVVLLKLGIIVDVYYASEIDQDSLTISSAHFGDRITYLGDVRNVTKEKVKEIMPIDLLIGGSPCNDLSLVNPARLGLHNPKGTGILFFEYIRILKQLKKSNKGHHLFWLYENVASMPSEFRLEMNKHLGQEPMVIDSADFSPQHRLRLYWHNLPQNPYFPQFQKQQDVQDILTPNCNRYALVKKIRTVTTRTNSLRQGKAEMKPIMMKGTSDTLWITELEEIFGFPRHYTDVKNLSATNRQRLIGKSWSVQTLTAILRPLCSYFKCNEDEKSQLKL